MTSTCQLFTCVTCHIGFGEHENQRDHYKTDWHRYNLKRKVVDMPPVTYQDFTERAKLQKDQEECVKGPQEMFCQVCNKHFTNENSFENHRQSRKHRENESSFILAARSRTEDSPETKDLIDQFLNVKSDRNEKMGIQMNEYLRRLERENEESEVVEEVEEGGETDLNWEDVADEDEEKNTTFDDSKRIPVNDCLFCESKFNSLEDKCEHMAKTHSFYIPDMAHVCDLEGLVRFLGIKVGVYHVCLWCSSKCYRDLNSVGKHMKDKGHQKMKFEGETLLEYTDFYSFDGDSTVEEEFELLDESAFTMVDVNSSVATTSSLALYSNDGQSNILKSNESDYELTLPSGARLGHRSLNRYYKQSFGHRNLEMKAQLNLTLKDKYLSIAMGQNYTIAETKKSTKDMMYFQRHSQKWRVHLSTKANKLQTHFRRQDICF